MYKQCDGAFESVHALQFIIFTATSVVPCLMALYTCSRGIGRHITQACLRSHSNHSGHPGHAWEANRPANGSMTDKRLLAHLAEVALAEAPVRAVGPLADCDLRRVDLVIHLSRKTERLR